MKNIIKALTCLLALPFTLTWATEGTQEVLYETIEAQRLIINWNPSQKSLATVLVYSCETCEIKKMYLDKNTRLIRETQDLDIFTLAQKVDWNGHLTISNQTTDRILKVEIFE